MTQDEVIEIVTLFSQCWHQFTVTQIRMNAWYRILKDQDAKAAFQAAKEICMTDSPYPPTPGQLLSQIHRPKADAPPSMEIALGYYEAGIWDAHPLVKKVANQVYWDRFNASERAIPQFKALYAAALASSDSDEPVKIDRAQISKSLPIREIES